MISETKLVSVAVEGSDSSGKTETSKAATAILLQNSPLPVLYLDFPNYSGFGQVIRHILSPDNLVDKFTTDPYMKIRLRGAVYALDRAVNLIGVSWLLKILQNRVHIVSNRSPYSTSVTIGMMHNMHPTAGIGDPLTAINLYEQVLAMELPFLLHTGVHAVALRSGDLQAEALREKSAALGQADIYERDGDFSLAQQLVEGSSVGRIETQIPHWRKPEAIAMDVLASVGLNPAELKIPNVERCLNQNISRMHYLSGQSLPMGLVFYAGANPDDLELNDIMVKSGKWFRATFKLDGDDGVVHRKELEFELSLMVSRYLERVLPTVNLNPENEMSVAYAAVWRIFQEFQGCEQLLLDLVAETELLYMGTQGYTQLLNTIYAGLQDS